MTSPSSPPSAFAALRQLARPRQDVERCELCGQLLASEHPHLLELARRRITCSCHACALLFLGQQTARYRTIPRDVRRLLDFALTDEEWDAFHIPINLAFFFHHSERSRVVACYPSPAGVTEALLPLDAWPGLIERNPVLADLQPDVEALLINRVGTRRDCYLAPIDECYRLVGLIRASWRGLGGGAAVWEEVERFFDRLRQRSDQGGPADA